jgi:hypothetical protein
MGHVLVPVLYRGCSADVRLVTMLRGQPGEMRVAEAVPFECICIVTRDAGEVASSPLTSQSMGSYSGGQYRINGAFH